MFSRKRKTLVFVMLASMVLVISIFWLVFNSELGLGCMVLYALAQLSLILMGVFIANESEDGKVSETDSDKEEREKLMEVVNGGLAVIEKLEDGKRRFRYGNQSLYDITKYDEATLKETLEKSILSLIYEDDLEENKEIIEGMDLRGRINLEFRIKRADGSPLWVHFSSTTTITDKSIIFYFVIIDINDFKTETEKLERVANNVPGGVMQATFDDGFHIIYATDGYYELTGYSQQEYNEYIENDYTRLFFENEYNDFIDRINKALENREYTINVICRIKCKDGNEKWLSFAAERIESITDSKPVYQCLVIDITKERKTGIEIEYERERYRLISDLCDDIVIEYNIKTDGIEINQRFEQIFGFEPIKKNFGNTLATSSRIHKDDVSRSLDFFSKLCKGEIKQGEFELRFLNPKTQKYMWAKLYAIAVNNEKIVGKISNIDDVKSEMASLKDKSQRDALTKLYNKLCSEDMINGYISNDGKDEKHALMMIDVDNFKSVNDNLGHVFGDIVLKEIAKNITEVFGDTAIAGRIGGDEFAVFLKNVKDSQEIDIKAEQLSDIFRNQYTGENSKYKISASIGISEYPKDGENFGELYKNADIAVYRAKQRGKDCFEHFSAEMAENEELIRKKARTIESDMREKSIMYENIVTNVIELVLETKDTHSTVNIILSIVGRHYGLDRICIFEKKYATNSFAISYEWEDTGFESIPDSEKDVPYMIIEEDKFNSDRVYTWKNDDENLSAFAKGRAESGVESAIEYMLKQDGIITAFICFESRKENNCGDAESYNSTLMILRLLANCIMRIKSDGQNKINNDIKETIIKNQNMYAYIINPESFQIVYENKPDDKAESISNIGNICYKSIMEMDKQCSFCPLKHLQADSTAMTTSRIYDKQQNKWFGITSKWIDFYDGTRKALICKNDITTYVEQMDYKDSLTGLSSLNKFKITSQMIFENRDYGKEYVFMYIDIDKFKFINDNFGYAKGDEILMTIGMVATRFFEPSGIIGESGMICRATDDKFMMMFEYDSDESVKAKIKAVLKKFDEMNERIFPNIHLVIICGVYITKNMDFDINSALDNANTARKTIKGSHRSRFAIYTDEMHSKQIKQKEIEGRMTEGISNKEFAVYYQPKVEISTGKIVGAEALVRWIKADGTIVPPGDFIDIFEKNGFIINLDFYVYEAVFAQMNQWVKEGKELVTISINISRLHISNPDFIENLYSLVVKYEVPIKYIELELTESIFLENINTLVKFVGQLKELGFKISIDDFGSAYSSLNMLKDIPVDVIKLDKEFFHHNNKDNRDKTIITHVINMVHDLNMQILCEGVETEEQVEFLTNAGCNLAQGYFYSKPVNKNDFEKMLYE